MQHTPNNHGHRPLRIDPSNQKPLIDNQSLTLDEYLYTINEQGE